MIIDLKRSLDKIIVMTGAIFISDNLVFGDVKFDVDTVHKQLYTPCVIHNHCVIYHPKKASIFSLWNKNMDGLPKWDGRVISSTGSTTARECGKVGRGDRRWCLSVRRVSQVGPSLPFSPLSPPQPISIRQTYFLFRGDLTRRGSRQKRRQVSPYHNLWKGTKKAIERLYFKGPFYIL